MKTTTRSRTGTGALRLCPAPGVAGHPVRLLHPDQALGRPGGEAILRRPGRPGGATVFERETGIWKGEEEKTDVFRLLVRPGDLSLGDAGQTLRKQIGQLMATLSTSAEFWQEALMYTETVVTVALAEKVTRLD